MNSDFAALGYDAWVTVAVIVGMIVALVREIARPDLILLTSLGILMVAQVITPEQAFTGFSNPAVLTVAALFVVAAGIQRTNALAYLDSRLLPERASLPGVIFRVMGSTSFLSAFLNNTPIVAMLMPGLQRWCERTGISPSRVMIPLSYAAITGGIITLIGTSTNLVVSGLLAERGLGGFTMFELTWVGLPAAIIVLIYFSTFGYRLLPDRTQKEGSVSDTHGPYLFDVRIQAGAPQVGSTVEMAGFRNLKKAFLVHIERGGHIILPVSPDEILQAGDTLTFSGDVGVLDNLAVREGIERVAPPIDGIQQREELDHYHAVVSLTSSLVGKTLKEASFRERFQGAVLAIQRKSEQIRSPVGKTRIKPGDLLLIEARKGFAQRWNANREEFYFVISMNREPSTVSGRAPHALAVVVLMVLLGATGVVPIVIAAFSAALAMVLLGCLKGARLKHAIDIPILLVIAAAFGIGQALDATGLAAATAHFIVGTSSAWGIIAVLVALYVATNIITELITNNAAAVLMTPIAIVAAVDLGINPHAFAVTIAVAASASFLSPIGYQTNLMVMGAGGYKFTDYFRAGLPITLILMVVTVTAVYFHWLD